MANIYSDLTVTELEEVYSVTKANYGTINGALLDEINRRGGEAAFLAQVEREKVMKQEKVRIANEVAVLMEGQSDPEFAKSMITSTLLDQRELSDFVDLVVKRHLRHQFNSKVDKVTIFGSIVGIVLSAFLGAVITFFQVYLLGKFFYVSLIAVYVVSWLTLRLITKKDARNAAVLISAVIATILGPALTFLFLMR
jgi:hypothetical protein